MELHRRQLLEGMGATALLALGARPLRALAEAAPAPAYLVLEIKAASSLEIGRQLGEALREDIQTVLGELDERFQRCRQALEGPLRPAVQAMHAAATQRFPELMQELTGLSEGSAVPFMELFAWNCRSEIGVLRNAAGCSSVGLPLDGGFILAHNEDGAAAYQGHMAVARVTPPSGVRFASLVYPGTLPGLGPGINARGLCLASNYISPATVTAGVPRFFIGRALCEAEDLSQAVAIATTEGRAFPWHHNLGDLQSGELLSLETWPDGSHDRLVVRSLHLHTNHLTHPAMAEKPEDRSYFAESSGPRMEVLERMAAERPPTGRDDLLAMLADRSGSPTRLCRHPDDDYPGVTLATAVFRSGQAHMELLQTTPCFGASMMVQA